MICAASREKRVAPAVVTKALLSHPKGPKVSLCLNCVAARLVKGAYSRSACGTAGTVGHR